LMDGFPHKPFEFKRRTDTIDIILPSDATGTHNTARLGSPTFGANGWTDSRQGQLTTSAKEFALFPAT